MKLFGTSGIRGKYGEKITESLAEQLGKAIGTYVKEDAVIIGQDPRKSGYSLKNALISQLVYYTNVIDLQLAPTPLVAFACNKYSKNGIIITASHNPKEYNGFKIIGKEGLAYSREKEKELERIISNKKYKKRFEKSKIIEKSIEEEYVNAILNKIKLKGKGRILIDPGNGAASYISPTILKLYGYEVIEINSEPDGEFPNRNPEPNEENLKETAKLVKKYKCDIGFCHDGDADRMMVIDDKGEVVDFDKFLIFLCKSIAETNKNKTVVTTVDTSMAAENYLKGFKIIRSKVGDVFVANEAKKYNACFGGEPSGSYIFPEFGMWPDGIYAIFKTLEALERDGRKISEILKEIPKPPMERTKIKCPNSKKEEVMKKIPIPSQGEILTKDGLLMKTKDSQILIRPSGTEEYIRINVEAQTKELMKEKVRYWKREIKKLVLN